MPPSTFAHDHLPLYRVVRAGWQNPLDTGYAKERGGRWNRPGEFAVLYTACSERVAAAITRDILGFAAVEIDDLMPATRPALAEVDWSGTVVNMSEAAAIVKAGFAPSYPLGVEHRETQPAGARWYAGGREGVVCRSASLSRMGMTDWPGDHAGWSETAIFVDNADRPPAFLQLRTRLDWLEG